jgi:choline dehydrogenase-like flavoprotein
MHRRTWENILSLTEAVCGRQVYLARGKVLGGSSSTNATLYHRGTPTDYDEWGVPGWTSRDVLPWFTKCEDNGFRERFLPPGTHTCRTDKWCTANRNAADSRLLSRQPSAFRRRS